MRGGGGGGEWGVTFGSGCYCSHLKILYGSEFFTVLLGSFRLDYEYEYDFDFQISDVSRALLPHVGFRQRGQFFGYNVYVL